MRNYKFLLIAAVVMIAFSGFIQPEKFKIAGIWKIVSVQTVNADGTVSSTIPVESQVIFTKRHYSFCWTSNTTALHHWQMPDSLKLARANQSIINAGTYALEGAILTTKATFAFNPMFVNGTARFKCSFENDTLVLTGLNVLSADTIQNPVYAAGAHFVNRLIKIADSK